MSYGGRFGRHDTISSLLVPLRRNCCQVVLFPGIAGVSPACAREEPLMKPAGETPAVPGKSTTWVPWDYNSGPREEHDLGSMGLQLWSQGRAHPLVRNHE